MIIVAKYSSICPNCGLGIDSGSKVEWSKGSKATHVTCPARQRANAPATSHAAPRERGEPDVSIAPFVRHEKWAPCKRAYLPDWTGKAIVAKSSRAPWASLRSGASGIPVHEGDALTVVSQRAYWESAEQNEDAGDMTGPGWQITLYLRRATEEEALPVQRYEEKARAERDAVALRKALTGELSRLCRAGSVAVDEAAVRPAGQEIQLDPGVHGSGRIIAVLFNGGSSVGVWCSGYYDDYRPSLFVSDDPRAVEIMRILLR